MADMQDHSICIRLACSEDAAEIALVLRESFAEYEHLYTKAAFDVTTPEPGAVLDRMKEGPIWVALVNDQIVGTASAQLTDDGLYIRGMGVRPSGRGRDIGRLLLKHVEAFAVARHIQRLFLSTTPFLERAISLYQGSGFRRIDGGPTDLLGTPLFTMEKRLGEAI